jgi:hypothetical protein
MELLAGIVGFLVGGLVVWAFDQGAADDKWSEAWRRGYERGLNDKL